MSNFIPLRICHPKLRQWGSDLSCGIIFKRKCMYPVLFHSQGCRDIQSLQGNTNINKQDNATVSSFTVLRHDSLSCISHCSWSTSTEHSSANSSLASLFSREKGPEDNKTTLEFQNHSMRILGNSRSSVNLRTFWISQFSQNGIRVIYRPHESGCSDTWREIWTSRTVF